MASHLATAKARLSCARCHKRKKRCDRALPSCRNCQTARVKCSFLDDDSQTASYPIAYVRNLERKIQEMENQRVAEAQISPPADGEIVSNDDQHFVDTALADLAVPSEDCIVLAVGNEATMADTMADAIHEFPPESQITSILQEPPPTFVEELKTLSLEATADRHLGSTSGLSFARLTQTVLRRLTPDKADFVFSDDPGNSNGPTLLDFNSPSDLINSSLFTSLSESVSIHPILFGDVYLADMMEPDEAMAGLNLPTDESHINRLVNFYFAHSHTLYPILQKDEFMQTLQRVRENPQDLASQSPLCFFRIWMVLAIGSTAYSSVSLMEESESRVYYNKALEYFEPAMAYGEMAALEVTMLQVSYSFFNQLGPNTWFLVGLAARLALGMGLHTSSSYIGVPVDVEQRRKRVFYSIYMMDRVVSVALGRPFALHDDDIDVLPFADADDEFIGTEGIQPQNSLQPSTMAVPLHILALRTLAGKIARQVYSNRQAANLSEQEREQILHSLHKELLDWRRNMPFPLPDIDNQVPHLSTNWYDFNYYTHLAMIYRPSPLFPIMDRNRVKILEDAASMSLRQAFNMHRQRQFAYNWLNLLAIFTSTLSLIYSITAQPDNLITVLKETRAIEDLDLAIELFDTLSVKFSAANKIRRMIAEISRRYKDLRSSSDEENIILRQE